MKKEELLALLRETPILSDDTLQYGEITTFNKGDYILNQGETLDHIYILIQGVVRTIHNNANGTAVYNGLSMPIDVIGQIELMNAQPISHDAIALSDCLTFAFDTEKYSQILFNDNVFMRYIAHSLAMICYNVANNSAISINFPVENRLASYLLSYAKDGAVRLNMASVAPMIGSSYRHLQRVMRKFIEKGYIEKEKRGLYKIKDQDALTRLGQDAYHFRS